MKISFKSLKFILIFVLNSVLGLFFDNQISVAQGFNENEWIFGECIGQPTNNYLSFGKSGIATVQSIPSTVLISAFNNAIAIDPITGQPLFVTNGELVYDFASNPLQGSAPGLNGDFEGHQKVATGFLEYDPAPSGNKLFYIFYLSRGGQLHYSLVDMNAPGQATGNERPLGEIIEKDRPIGPAQGAILVIKTPSSPSYLISFDKGNLISRRLETAPGTLPQVGLLPVSFTPKSMIFDAKRSQLVLVPEGLGNDIIVLDFDSSTGIFSNPEPIINSGNVDNFGGVTFSPDGKFIYFSRGQNLFRIPSDDLTATPELIPFTPNVAAVYDLKTGPDGNLYYIYEEVIGGPQLIGRVTNPNETDLALVSLEADPFAGTDFCGRIFPIFAPNADIDPSVDFTWSPDEPCANNPIQLTSVISPENYQPVSFSWTFNPPLTDENGDPLTGDFTQEHFLVPGDAAQGTEINVTLTVTFADGTIKDQSYLIPLTENDLQANFTPSDTTLCESCLDLDPLLEAQAGGGTGGTGGGSGGTGGGTSYEYFWSNKRDLGWIAKAPNEVCKPGLYWALVREPGSSCYAYAEIRVKMWDVQDQTNNIWYFGDGSGLDFNPDPDDPEAPTPRPLAAPHSQNIPAGTTTISDQAGQVLFFTDGQSVWDLNGDLMANGNEIGGDNASSQSVLAVPVPQEQTLFYLFTTQVTANGTNEVRFSLVDIKAENTTGVGNVVSKANFLFSPSTEQAAGFNAGDTTWVMFHELGNNTFRAYPVTANGIGQPVFSSVGSNHGFNSGVGSMKFSPDGTKLAVTISEGGRNRVEIFNFNPTTGLLTEYARLELGNVGNVFGLEFSNDSDRIFVSYRNGGPGIEEFVISSVTNEDPSSVTCPTCLGTSTSRAALETCILSTRSILPTTAGLNLGALQIGPNGIIYAAVVGSNLIGQINAGTGCNTPSSFSTDGVAPLTGTTNLGLPAFVQNSGSSIPEPALSVPENFCIDPNEASGVIFDGGGEPDIDSYFWTITAQDGTVIRSNYGGPGDQFQSLEQQFTNPGIYTVDLRVDRCAEVGYFTESAKINVLEPPKLTLADDATLCAGNPVTLTAINGYNPTEGLYDFLWTNAAGQVFGDSNSNSITVDQESIYTVTVTYRNSANSSTPTCPAVRSVFAGPAFEFEINQSAFEVCFEDTIVSFAPDTPISGQWFYTRNGDPTRVLIGAFFELELRINRQLPGSGNYEIFFIAEDPILSNCKIEKQVDLIVHELPALTATQAAPASSCLAADGSFIITMQADASIVSILGTTFNFTNVAAGEALPPITGLEAGNYTIEAENRFGCSFTFSVSISNSIPPTGFDYSVTTLDETCSPTGIEDGILTIVFTSGPQTGSYEIIRQEDGTDFTGTFASRTTVDIAVPFGTYLVNVLDPTGCNIPMNGTFVISEKNEVVYSVPTNLNACENFSFKPESPTTLNYELADPIGNKINPDAEGNFSITATGQYTITGIDPSGNNCPKIAQINAVISTPTVFDISPPIIDCQAGVKYEAELPVGTDISQFIFLWRDELGILVGRRNEFIPSRAGTYSLEVQPIAGGLCPSNRISFTAATIDPRLTVTLEVQPFCVEQTSTLLEVKTNLSTVAAIEWFRVVGGTKTRILSLNDSVQVNLSQEGIYEVILRSAAGCEIGRATGSVLKSTIIPPSVPAIVTICAIENVIQTISPGTYNNYVWKLDGNLVSQDSTFTPTDPGTYELTVSDNLGCEYIENFEVMEDCQLKISLPNALVLSDPERNFILYANEFIDEAAVFIFNRWGELIFYCSHENLNPGNSFCPWDGIVDGKFVPVGTYAVKVKFTSKNQNKTQSITQAITIIQ